MALSIVIGRRKLLDLIKGETRMSCKYSRRWQTVFIKNIRLIRLYNTLHGEHATFYIKRMSVYKQLGEYIIDLMLEKQNEST